MNERPADSKRRRHVIAITMLLVLGVGIGGYAWWMDKGRHLFYPKNWGVVEEGRIYRSGWIYEGIVEDALKDHGIQVIVDLAGGDVDKDEYIGEAEAAKKLGIRKIDLAGLNGWGTGEVEDYVVALREIVRARAADEPVLVHCAAGSERTGGVVAAYRMLFQGWDGDRAWEEYKSYRKDPPERPDLANFVNGNLPHIVERLQALGVPVDPPDPLPRFGPPGGM